MGIPLLFLPMKFAFAQEEVEFAGIVISNVGIKPTKRYIQAIKTFPTPRNIHDVRSWFTTYRLCPLAPSLVLPS